MIDLIYSPKIEKMKDKPTADDIYFFIQECGMMHKDECVSKIESYATQRVEQAGLIPYDKGVELTHLRLYGQAFRYGDYLLDPRRMRYEIISFFNPNQRREPVK